MPHSHAPDAHRQPGLSPQRNTERSALTTLPTLPTLTAKAITCLFAGSILVSLNATAATLAGNCNPVRVSTCALPFPSDLFTEEDSSTATGKRVVIPDDTFDLFAQETADAPVALDRAMRPQALYAGSSGFSAASPVLFELDAPMDESAITVDGGEVLQVYEIGGDGTPVPLRVGVMNPARTEGVSRMDNVIEAFPRSRWKFGGRYVAVLTRALKPAAGGEYTRSAGLQAIFDAPESAVGQAHTDALATLLPALEQQGRGADDILAMTFFTVRDEAQVITPLATLMQKVNAQAHEFRGWNVEYTPNAYKAVTITGQVKLSNYRDEKGGLIFDASYPGDDYWANFILIIPQSASEKPAPVVVYGHGIGATKETMDVVDQFNAQRGIATFAIDQPNHGTRSEQDGGFIWDILAPEHLNRVVGMVSQSSLDMVSVIAAIDQRLKTLDTLPRNPNFSLFPWLALSERGYTPDLDLSHIYYEGTSMGGVLGSGFLGLAPRLDGAFLQVSGVGVINILTHSTLWSRFKNMVPGQTQGAELAAYLGMLTQALDYGDGINSIHHVREGTSLLPYPYKPFPVAVQMGLGDGIVFNNSSVALSELAVLPKAIPNDINDERLMAAYNDLPLVPLADTAWLDDDGYGLRMVKPFQINVSETSWLGRLFDHTIDLVNALAPHASFFGPGSKEFQAAWTDQVILKQNSAQPEAGQP